MGDHDVVTAVEAALMRYFGVPSARASISFVGVEPIDVLQFEQTCDEQVLATVGMSAIPMLGPEPAATVVDGGQVGVGPRAELFARFHRGRTTAARDLWRRLAVVAATPMVDGVVIADGVSVELGEPLTARSQCVGVVVADSALAPVATPCGSVQLFRVLPATSSELAWCRTNGSDRLRKRWSVHNTDLLDLDRDPVPLS